MDSYADGKSVRSFLQRASHSDVEKKKKKVALAAAQTVIIHLSPMAVV